MLDELSVDALRLRALRHHSVHQRLSEQHIDIRAGRVALYPVQLRYAWPSELDLMARIDSLRLREHYGGWCGETFTPASYRHVSVYAWA
jgi:hypothetical protein